MAARRWRVEPDEQTLIGGQPVDVCSREAVVAAIMDAESIGARMGGVVTIMWGRQRTDFPGEAVTTGVAIEWKPGVQVRDQPEPETTVLPFEHDEEHDKVVNTRTGEVLTVETVDAEGLAAARADDNPDGFDHSQLAEEDDSAIAEAVG